MVDHGAIEIRSLVPEDGAALERLAQADTTDPPPSPLIGGIVDGRLVVAHSLATGGSIADPFRPTAEIRSLLAARAAQLRGRGSHRRRLRRLRRRLRGDIAAPRGTASEPAR